MSQHKAAALKVVETASAAREVARHAEAREGRGDTEASAGTLIGICLGAEHPTLAGRAHIRWSAGEGEIQAAWLPQLQGVRARQGDRVLLATPGNHDEPVVMGVLDGIGPVVLAPSSDQGPLLQLAEDEALRIAGPDGQPILEVKPTADGPEIRLFTAPAALTMPGSFRVSADQIEFEARKGEVRIDAAGDVKVSGEIIRLN